MRRIALLVWTSLFFVFIGGSLYFFFDDITYAFAPQGPALRLGSVADFYPNEIPLNTFVEIDGITEHRGLMQQRWSVHSLRRQEFWYWRLAGSRGVFLEVPANATRLDGATDVRARGRAIDPRRGFGYAALVKEYDTKSAQRDRPSLRLIQVDLTPGTGKRQFTWAAVLCVTLVTFTGVCWWLLRRRPSSV